MKNVISDPDWKQREQEAYSENDRIESLARDLFVRHIGTTNGNYREIAEQSWVAAREFYRVKE